MSNRRKHWHTAARKQQFQHTSEEYAEDSSFGHETSKQKQHKQKNDTHTISKRRQHPGKIRALQIKKRA